MKIQPWSWSWSLRWVTLISLLIPANVTADGSELDDRMRSRVWSPNQKEGQYCTTPITIPTPPPPFPTFAVTGHDICASNECQVSTCSDPHLKKERPTSGVAVGLTQVKVKGLGLDRAERGLTLTPPASTGNFVLFTDFVCDCNTFGQDYDCAACIKTSNDNSTSCFQNAGSCGKYCFGDDTPLMCTKYIDRSAEVGALPRTYEFLHIYCTCCFKFP